MIVAIALGSNLGDRRAHLDYGVAALRAFLPDLRVSRYHETDPVGVAEPQPRFLNAAAVATTDLDARELLARLHAIERARDRERPYPNAPRTLDLDVVLLGDVRIADPDLVVPHPRFRERRFVLEPLAEIAPDLREPVTQLTIAELLSALSPKP